MTNPQCSPSICSFIQGILVAAADRSQIDKLIARSDNYDSSKSGAVQQVVQSSLIEITCACRWSGIHSFCTARLSPDTIFHCEALVNPALETIDSCHLMQAFNSELKAILQEQTSALQQLHRAVSHRRAQETASAKQDAGDSAVSLLELAVHTSVLQVESFLLKCKALLSF